LHEIILMKSKLLFPNYFKFIGVLLYIGAFCSAQFYTHNLDDVMYYQGFFVQLSALAGLLFIAGAREQREDELINHYRLTSVQWSVFILVLLRVLFKAIAFYTKDTDFLPIYLQTNFLLLLYIIIFYYQLHIKNFFFKILKRGNEHEE
jgi:hypothetical protein